MSKAYFHRFIMCNTALWTVLAFTAVIAALIAAPNQGTQAPLVLTGVTIIDGTGAPPAPGMTLVIDRGRIADIFTTGAKPLPAGADVRDLGGRFVIPGLIESHTHLGPLATPERREAELRRMLRGGIVAAREMAGGMTVSRSLRERALRGDIDAPDLYYPLLVAGPGFMAADPRVSRPGGSGAGGMVSSLADAGPVVDRAVAGGAAAVKIYAQVDVPVIRAIADAAHRRGLRVWAHPTMYPARPIDVVRAGVDAVSHACGVAWQDPDLDPSAYTAVNLKARPRFDPALVDADGPEMTALFTEMAQRGVVFDPTLAVHAKPGDDQFGCTTDLMVALARAAKRAGVTLLAGTDFHAGDGSPHPSLHEEIELLVTSGVLTPHEAITAATLNPARAMGIDADLGTIAPGKAASLVVLESNPVEDIAAIRKVVLVIKKGRPVSMMSQQPPVQPAVAIDHFILAINDLDRGVADFERMTGVRPVFGGVHPGRGTQNALASLGDGRYIEILAPNPKEPNPAQPIGGLAALTALMPAGWALGTADLREVAKRAEARGLGVSPIRPGARALPDGSRLEWKTLGIMKPAHNWAPFFIKWANPALQPSATSPRGCTLQSAALEDPNPDPLRALFDAVGFDMPLKKSDVSRMTIVLRCPKGTVTFR